MRGGGGIFKEHLTMRGGSAILEEHLTMKGLINNDGIDKKTKYTNKRNYELWWTTLTV